MASYTREERKKQQQKSNDKEVVKKTRKDNSPSLSPIPPSCTRAQQEE